MCVCVCECVLCVHKGFPGSSAGKKSTHNAGDLGLIPGFGRCPGDGNSYPLQYSGLENFMDYFIGSKQSDTIERLSLSLAPDGFETLACSKSALRSSQSH